jgi:hypothetical protein
MVIGARTKVSLYEPIIPPSKRKNNPAKRNKFTGKEDKI